MHVVVCARILLFKAPIFPCVDVLTCLSLICGQTLGCFPISAAVNTGVCLKTGVIAMCFLDDGMIQDGAQHPEGSPAPAGGRQMCREDAIGGKWTSPEVHGGLRALPACVRPSRAQVGLEGWKFAWN